MNDRHADGHTDWLKPCPFCGGKAEIVSCQIAEDEEAAWGQCKTCFTRTDGIESPFADRPAAAALWNQRATESVMLAALREAREHIAEQRRELSPPFGDPCDIETCDMTLATIDAAIQQATGGSDE